MFSLFLLYNFISEFHNISVTDIFRWPLFSVLKINKKSCLLCGNFISIYVIKRTLHGRLGIRILSSRAESILQHLKIKFVSPHGHVISSISRHFDFMTPECRISNPDIQLKAGVCNLEWAPTVLDSSVPYKGGWIPKTKSFLLHCISSHLLSKFIIKYWRC